MLKRGPCSAYYKPSVALTSAITSHDRLLDKLARKAGLEAGDWRQPDAEITRTTWDHYVECADRQPPLLRLRRLRSIEPPQVSRKDIQQAAMLAEMRLVSVQQPEGFFLYEYHPFTQKSTMEAVSAVRQAGCAMAMAQAAETTADEELASQFKKSAIRAINFLLERAATLPGGGIYIRDMDQERGTLGATALTLAAIQRPPLAALFARERVMLRSGILELQRPDGSFRCWNDSGSAADDGTKADYYPGEALVALCYEARDGSIEAYRAVQRAFPWHQEYFRRKPVTALVPWHVDAWRLFAALSSDNPQDDSAGANDYAGFVFEMMDWLLQFQLDPANVHSDFAGGFTRLNGPPGEAKASFVEAVVRAYGLAVHLKSTALVDRYRTAARSALGFLQRLQISPQMSFQFPDPTRCVGGTTKSLSDFTIRCDNDQHAITTFLAALETPDLLSD